jgi:hypothetical protein
MNELSHHNEGDALLDMFDGVMARMEEARKLVHTRPSFLFDSYIFVVILCMRAYTEVQWWLQ